MNTAGQREPFHTVPFRFTGPAMGPTLFVPKASNTKTTKCLTALGALLSPHKTKAASTRNTREARAISAASSDSRGALQFFSITSSWSSPYSLLSFQDPLREVICGFSSFRQVVSIIVADRAARKHSISKQ